MPHACAVQRQVATLVADVLVLSVRDAGTVVCAVANIYSVRVGTRSELDVMSVAVTFADCAYFVSSHRIPGAD